MSAEVSDLTNVPLPGSSRSFDWNLFPYLHLRLPIIDHSILIHNALNGVENEALFDHEAKQFGMCISNVEHLDKYLHVRQKLLSKLSVNGMKKIKPTCFISE